MKISAIEILRRCWCLATPIGRGRPTLVACRMFEQSEVVVAARSANEELKKTPLVGLTQDDGELSQHGGWKWIQPTMRECRIHSVGLWRSLALIASQRIIDA